MTPPETIKEKVKRKRKKRRPWVEKKRVYVYRPRKPRLPGTPNSDVENARSGGGTPASEPILIGALQVSSDTPPLLAMKDLLLAAPVVVPLITRKPAVSQVGTTPKITEFFRVRRSGRKTKKLLEEEMEAVLHVKILEGSNEPLLEIFIDQVKGRGIRTTVPFKKGEFVIEYRGKMIGHAEARSLEDKYSEAEDIGSYMFFFEHRAKKWCVDATEETEYKGRLVNHSLRNANLKARVVDIGRSHHLILVACRNVEIGEELLYDYGDRSSNVCDMNPWLRY